ncbi:hypothetical protein CDAR_565551 [Caerostris darwini]|uniref:Uncharacterized protein n=1 Tax=Caerostris darwini TaxID=1538125 RepID=A0AAV4TWE2_9ARAC|nr:hypothetical protein CDAR_565551 [Caerostris darwini]
MFEFNVRSPHFPSIIQKYNVRHFCERYGEERYIPLPLFVSTDVKMNFEIPPPTPIVHKYSRISFWDPLAPKFDRRYFKNDVKRLKIHRSSKHRHRYVEF